MATVGSALSRRHAETLDAEDPLAPYRDRFVLPDGIVYLDGNSLGPPPRRVLQRLEDVLAREWSRDLIRSWTHHGWIDLQQRVATTLAPLIGAAPDEVAVADSTTVNLFKLLAVAGELRPGRPVVLSERANFPTDLYVAQGMARLLGDRVELRLVDRADLADSLSPNVAVLMLTHVDFRTGEMHDMVRWTAAAHDVGAVALWDLAHSAGAVPVDLTGCGADLAVGCGYKYLNGGPGAPAFAYVAGRHHGSLVSPLWGWMGHAAPFEFEPEFRPGPRVASLLVGTPPILSLAALECGVESIADIGVDRLRTKSVALTELFIELVESRCPDHDFELASPRDPDRRGSQVSLRHPEAHAIIQALIAAGVVGDFRAPDLMRFGFAPAYLRFVDVWQAVATIGELMASSAWDRPEFRVRARVT